MIVPLLQKKYTEENGLTFIPPFDDLRIIEGQGTVGVEIFEEQNDIDWVEAQRNMITKFSPCWCSCR